MAAGKDKKIAARRLKVADMLDAGFGVCDIARKLKVNHGTISRDAKAILEEWKSERVDKVDHMLDLSLRQIDIVIRKAYEGYKRSVGKTETTTTKTGGEHGEETTVKVEHQAGDSAHLGKYLDAVKERNKLLGLYPAEKHDHNHSGIPAVIETIVTTPEEIKSFKEMMNERGGSVLSDE